MPYRKTDVETHSASYYGKEYPAINIKAYHSFTESQVEEHFKCSEETARRASQFAWNSACEAFWEDAPSFAREILGQNVEVYSAGRSGGWLIVEGLPDVDDWPLMLLNKWHRLESYIKKDVRYRLSWEVIRENIEANRWAEDGAEEFNYVDQNGETLCLVDLKAKAKDAGLSAVIRP